MPPNNLALELMTSLRLVPDPWQVEVLTSAQTRLLLNCCRQAGKSTTVAIIALAEAMFWRRSLVLLVSRSFRQSSELFRMLTEFHRRLGSPMLVRRNAQELVLDNQSRIVCLPCREETIRGFSGATLLVIDEAARVPDDLYRAVRPMLAISAGRMICLSTPYGKRGFFWQAWARGGADWGRVEAPATLIPRIAPDFLEAERRGLGDSCFRQEYLCSFESLEGLVYPEFPRCVVTSLPAGMKPGDRKVGGIDFGFRNPFAAIWGQVTHDGVLVLTGEHYCRQQPLSYHAQHLPKGVNWYADPSGATERAELRMAGFAVHEGNNALRLGIAAVTARIQSGTLQVLDTGCPNLIEEAALYCYSDDPAERHAEIPVDEHNHALAALRYLISVIDARRMAGRPFSRPPDSPPAAKPEGRPPPQLWYPMR
jgi:hypothetical protein